MRTIYLAAIIAFSFSSTAGAQHSGHHSSRHLGHSSHHFGHGLHHNSHHNSHHNYGHHYGHGGLSFGLSLSPYYSGSYRYYSGYPTRYERFWPYSSSYYYGIPNGYYGLRPSTQSLTPAAIASPSKSTSRSKLLVEKGDDLFRKQRYEEALLQYQSASNEAPNSAEFYFRQGHTWIASNRYDLAAQAFKLGLMLDASWAKSSFRLDTLYGGQPAVKTSHIEALANKALENPKNSDLMFLLGIFLTYDGQAERAQKFFQQASLLAGDDKAHLQHFLADAAKKERVAQSTQGLTQKKLPHYLDEFKGLVKFKARRF